MVTLGADQQQECRWGENAQKRKTGGYVCSMPSISLFQCLHRKKMNNEGKKGRHQQLYPLRTFMKTKEDCDTFCGLSKKQKNTVKIPLI